MARPCAFPAFGFSKVAGATIHRGLNDHQEELELSLAVANVQPTGAVALAAPFLVLGPRSDAGGASFPIGFVRCASNDAGAALACGDLGALAIDLVHGIRDGSAARANRHGLWFLASSLTRFGGGFGVGHGCTQAVQMLGIRFVRVEAD